VDGKSLPEALAKLNFVFFEDDARFEVSADLLAEGLNTDISWIRKHTEIGEQARRWTSAGRPGGLLLRSPGLEQAEQWIAAAPKSAPPTTVEIHREGRGKRRHHSEPGPRLDPTQPRGAFDETHVPTATATYFAAVQESGPGRYCCKSLFALMIKDFPGCRRDFHVRMWGTSSPDDKLASDLANPIEATQTGGRRFNCPVAGKSSSDNFGLLQQYLP
jgi:hypothetical protein